MVSIPTIFIGAKLAGVAGVALALLFINLAMMVPSYFFLIRPLIGSCGADYSMTIVKPTTIACLMGLGVLLAGQSLIRMSGAVRLMIEVVFGAGLYIVLNRMSDRHFFEESLGILVPRLSRYLSSEKTR